MKFFGRIGEGWKLFVDSLIVLFKKPIFLVPILFSWVIVAAVVLYNRYYFEFPSNIWVGILYIYLMVFLMAFVISIANIVMLEIVQQMESGEKVCFSKALKEAFGYDLIKVIPIAIIWAIVWLIIVILRALTSKSRGKGKAEPSARDAARTLSGMNTPFSWVRLGLDMLEKLIRMIVFLALPAVAWENQGPFSAFRKSFRIIKKHPVQFLTSYTVTAAAAMFMALPLVPIYIMDEFGHVFSSAFWTGVIIYVGIIWTLGIYLEQMSVGLLYLWHLKWVKKGSKGELSSVQKPDLFDEIHELK